MLLPQLRGYTPLKVGNQQLNISHQIALSIFAFVVIGVVGWHFFDPSIISTSPTTVAAAASTLTVAGKKALPRDWTLSDKTPQGTSGWQKPKGLRKIVGLIFYGRRASVSILDCYLKRNLVSNGGLLDEVVFLARTEIQEDLDWLNRLVADEPLYKRHDVPTYGKSYASSYDICEDDVMYIKIDDDIIFFEDTTIPTLVRTRWEHPEYYVVSANIMNQPSLSWVHHHLGVIKPYLPELAPPKPTDEIIAASHKPTAELNPRDDMQPESTLAPPQPSETPSPKQEAQSAAQASHPPESPPSAPSSSSSSALPPPPPPPPKPETSDESQPDKPNWRASLLPAWSGPNNFSALDFTPDHIPHRWLPLHSSTRDPSSYFTALDSTPIMETKYGAFTPALYHWTIGAQEHYSFLEHLENNELWRYKFHIWDYYYQRLGIQFIAIMGRDINIGKPLEEDDEAYFSEKMPARLKRHAVVEGRALAAHFSFAPQSEGMKTTDILERYRSFAEENICLASRGR